MENQVLSKLAELKIRIVQRLEEINESNLNSKSIDISHIYSTRSFFIHLNYDEVNNFDLNLNEYYNLVAENDSLNPSSISIKQLCCVMKDSRYYRAQILNETNGSYLVRFVDFGVNKMVQPKSIFKLFPEYSEIPFLALHCYLEGAWTDDFTKLEIAFMDFLTMPNAYCTEIKAKFQSSLSSNKIPVSLEVKVLDGSWKDLKDCNCDRVNVAECVSMHIFNFKDFSENLVHSFLYNARNVYQTLYSLSENPLTIGCSYNGICTDVTSVSNFIFSQSLATNLTTNLSKFYREMEHLSTPNLLQNNLVVICLDDFYFRAIILNMTKVDNTEYYKLFSVDFGFELDLENDSIYQLYDQFSLANFPSLSAMCAIDNIFPKYENWNKEANQTFKTFVQGTFTIYPKSFSNGKYSVEVEMANKNRASDMLKKSGFCKEELI